MSQVQRSPLNEAIRFAQTCPLPVKRLPIEELILGAKNFIYEDVNYDDPIFDLDMIIVNYIRHELTPYDDAIEVVKFFPAAIWILTRRTFKAISGAYPQYRSVAQVQMKKKVLKASQKRRLKLLEVQSG